MRRAREQRSQKVPWPSHGRDLTEGCCEGAPVPPRPKAGLPGGLLSARVAHTVQGLLPRCVCSGAWRATRSEDTHLGAQWRVLRGPQGQRSRLQRVPLGSLQLGGDQAQLWEILDGSLSQHKPPPHTHFGGGRASDASPAHCLSLLGGGGLWSPALQAWCSGHSAPVSSPHWLGAKLFIQGPGSQAGWACSHLKGERWRGLLGVPFKFQCPEAGSAARGAAAFLPGLVPAPFNEATRMKSQMGCAPRSPPVQLTRAPYSWALDGGR